jgi:hypothetical protein
MLSLVQKAAAHIQKLEADRLSAIAASEEKAREAQLIEARLEGFRQAMELMGVEPSPILTDQRRNKRRGKRRNISKLILTELSFSGGAMTTNQVAAAIDYLPERTEKALKRLENSGQVLREADGGWSATITMSPQGDGPESANGTFSIKKGRHKE